jgi:Tol biopolymer transport system component
MDRQGKSTPLLEERGREYLGCSLSPEGQRLAVSIIERSKMDVWIYDLVRGTKSRLTIDGGSFDPTWSPDGRDVVFVTRGEGAAAFYSAPADGSRPPAPLAPVRGWLGSGSFSPDGRLFAFNQINPRTGGDIAILPLAGDRTPVPFLATASHESSPAFSPDGRLLAYQSDEPGRLERYAPVSRPGEQVDDFEGGWFRPALGP